MALFHRRPVTTAVEAAPIPVPRFSIDGWTLAGDPLAGKLAKGDLRELETLLHGIAVEVDTPYTYERAAILLDRAGRHRARALGVRGVAGPSGRQVARVRPPHPGHRQAAGPAAGADRRPRRGRVGD